MPKYILCPRCELNYILEGDTYCDVCKAELKIGPQLMFSINDEVKEQVLCPICKNRYMNEGEDMCFQCKEEGNYKNRDIDCELDIDKDDNWRQFLDEDEKEAISNQCDDDELLLSQIEEEEALEEEDEDIDPYTQEKISNNNDIEDDFDYSPVNQADFEDYEEKDEDESEEDDF